MNLISRDEQAFLNRLTAIVEVNLSNEQFGVSELVAKMGVSRSLIHRKLKSAANQSFSQFIREIRLKKAKDLLEQEKLTVSEIAYNVGFGSPSYFIKCFHEKFGFAPGEYLKYAPGSSEKKSSEKTRQLFYQRPLFVLLTIVIVFIIISFYLYFTKDNEFSKKITEKSIAILPFDNLSSNDDNQYFADGIVEDLLTRLSTVNNLKVISRTSSEMFRNKGNKTIPEIGKILGVDYILEGTVKPDRQFSHRAEFFYYFGSANI